MGDHYFSYITKLKNKNKNLKKKKKRRSKNRNHGMDGWMDDG
jgi:hypothetical protein